jgi:hypothetical protein
MFRGSLQLGEALQSKGGVLPFVVRQGFRFMDVRLMPLFAIKVTRLTIKTNCSAMDGRLRKVVRRIRSGLSPCYTYSLIVTEFPFLGGRLGARDADLLQPLHFLERREVVVADDSQTKRMDRRIARIVYVAI